ncbi:SRPBCC family protein [Dactylosporangium sp. AC04546]|uniref:SRPBCC family protein n=1 Tax=Dactylosporangium sp. AC04546 TaxID=2862460 RepID=UPI001EDD0E48|nr:SRPBCC family protein [Dactylosporangium sp. AC04546]WVK85923.1 SRPBCC family protein [Dactylosporangium sp. AC04546]
MAVDVFTHVSTVAATPDAVHAHLADPESYVGLSPLVVEVRDIERDGNVVRYTAVERFGLYRNRIRVTMTLGERQVTSEVVSPGRVRLRAVTDLAPHADGTEVTETVTVTSPRILRRFVSGQARSVQLRRAAELARRFS